MTRERKWTLLVGLAAACLLAPPLWADEVAPKTTAKALETGDPDNIDPNDIKGEKWTLDFQYEAPTPIVVTTPGGQDEVYVFLSQILVDLITHILQDPAATHLINEGVIDP